MTSLSLQTRGNSLVRAAALSLLAFSCTTAATAQTPATPGQMNMADHRGGISGTVRSGSGVAVSGATVTATNAENGAQFTATADAQGSYGFAALPVGKYDLSIESSGVTVYRQSGVEVVADRTEQVNITLDAATAGQAAQGDRQEL